MRALGVPPYPDVGPRVHPQHQQKDMSMNIKSAAYRVFLTPNGDTCGLFVQKKTLQGFIVPESQGGRSTVTFDYRIVATPLGQLGRRMSAATGISNRLPAALRRASLTVQRPAMPPIPKLLNLR